MAFRRFHRTFLSIFMLLCVLLSSNAIAHRKHRKKPPRSAKTVRVKPKTNNEHRYLQHVVRIKITKAGESTGLWRATGFAVSPTHILTNHHVCEPKIEKPKKRIIYVEIPTKQGVVFNALPAKIIKHYERDDLCLLQTREHGLKPVRLAKTTVGYNTEDKVSILGNPRGIFPVRTDGYIGRNNPSSSRMMVSLIVYPGSSGSALFHKNECIGIISKHAVDVVHVGYAIKAERIRIFLKNINGVLE